MTTTVTGTIKAATQAEAEKAQAELEVIVNHQTYSEVEKRQKFIALGASSNDDGNTSAKIDFGVTSDDLQCVFNGTVSSGSGWVVQASFTWTFR